MGRFGDDDYEKARRDTANVLQLRIDELDRTYDIAEGMITRGPITITKGRGLRNRATISIVLSLLSKALKTSRAIRVTAVEGCGQDAGVLVRVLFETTTAVLWILQRNTERRAGLYVAHADFRYLIASQEQARTRGLRKLGKRRLLVAQRQVDHWIQLYGRDAVQSVRKHWSGLSGGLEAAARQLKGWMRAYNTVYRETSAYAHGADPGSHILPSTDPSSLGVFTILPGVAESDRVLAVTNVLLWTLVTRINGRFGLGLEAQLGELRVQRLKVPRGR